MRPSLPHPRRERRQASGHRRIRAVRVAHPSDPTPDPAVLRAREAGGPVDRAVYSCECGYLFVAAVSTTVLCPHCGVGQAW
jgi:hypothetical protein